MPKLLNSYKARVSDEFGKSVKVGLIDHWDFSNAPSDKEEAFKAVGLVASVCYNYANRDYKKLALKLVKAGHESPYEFVSWWEDNKRKTWRHYELPSKYNSEKHFNYIATFFVIAPLIVREHLVRHRAGSYMSLSFRFVKNFIEFYNPINADNCYKEALNCYNALLKAGIRKERARLVLPQGIMTKFWIQMDYKGLANLFLLRLNPSAQEETRAIVKKMALSIKENQPILWENILQYLREDYPKEVREVFQITREALVERFFEEILPELQ